MLEYVRAMTYVLRVGTLGTEMVVSPAVIGKPCASGWSRQGGGH